MTECPSRAARPDPETAIATASGRRTDHDPATRAFVAATLTYDKGLTAFLAVLALVRGVEPILGPDAADAAPTLGLGKRSRVLAGPERASAVGAFRRIANARLTQPASAPPVDQLDELR